MIDAILKGKIVATKTSVLSGDIKSGGSFGAKWGAIKGDIDNQIDLKEKLDEKYDSDNFTSMTNTEIDDLFR